MRKEEILSTVLSPELKVVKQVSWTLNSEELRLEDDGKCKFEESKAAPPQVHKISPSQIN